MKLRVEGMSFWGQWETLIGISVVGELLGPRPVGAYEQKQIDEVREIAETINFLGRTLPPDTDITTSVIALKARFDRIDGAAIRDAAGRADYDAVKKFFDTHLG